MRRYPPLRLLPRLYKFTFVRNPYTRILSAYLNKLFGPERDRLLAKIGLSDPEREVSFLQFLQNLEKKGLYADMHWAPQADIIPYERDQLDKIGRIESLEEDLSQVVDKCFGQQLRLKNKESGRTGADNRLKEYLGTEEQKLIERIYARDFELFYPDADPY